MCHSCKHTAKYRHQHVVSYMMQKKKSHDVYFGSAGATDNAGCEILRPCCSVVGSAHLCTDCQSVYNRLNPRLFLETHLWVAPHHFFQRSNKKNRNLCLTLQGECFEEWLSLTIFSIKFITANRQNTSLCLLSVCVCLSVIPSSVSGPEQSATVLFSP